MKGVTAHMEVEQDRYGMQLRPELVDDEESKEAWNEMPVALCSEV